MNFHIRKACTSDISVIAQVHHASFPRQGDSERWVSCTLAAEPRFLVFVGMLDGSAVGYIFWSQKSGFRAEVVLELDQIAILPECRGKGLAERLIRESLHSIETALLSEGRKLKATLVSTREDNQAQLLYAKALGAKPVARIADLYSAAEVILLARK
ncbi:GNAT family N-acetyltransferase [Diaphorobacter sp. HDW4B]|uniref:GNAT family N-acetyltransferase n=1 Tax=Diaphorobacter sp. HDW4B TaxID=2714925 RepID=UPI00140874E4|nr:GNAT family N-acetyltransferase [Diaphorobacter sp. HDW4B]QIL70158.1 GNAT family N-acetyltransferase [Diaphorobacter sp. HDW4B]